MTKSQEKVDMGFTRQRFPHGTHMCLIYNNDAMRDQIMRHFLARGVATGEQVVYFTDTTDHLDLAEWQHNRGITFPDDARSSSFNLLRAEEVYYPSGRFTATDMIGRLCNCYDQARRDGFAGLRGSGEMSWALRGIPGSEELIKYESLINTVSPNYPFTPICQYDARLFDGATILNVLKVHPLMIVQGQIVSNPYYLTPEEFDKEYYS